MDSKHNKHFLFSVLNIEKPMAAHNEKPVTVIAPTLEQAQRRLERMGLQVAFVGEAPKREKPELAVGCHQGKETATKNHHTWSVPGKYRAAIG